MKHAIYFSLLILGLFFTPQVNWAQSTDMTVLVRNASDVSPIHNAEVHYLDRTGRKTYAGSSNSEGYLRFTVPFKPGEKIIVIAGKQGEYSIQQLEWLIRQSNVGPNNPNFYLREFEGLKIQGHIYDGGESGNLPVGGVRISVPNPTGNRDIYTTSPSGYYEFSTLIDAGQDLPFRIQKAGYDLLEQSRTLQQEGPGSNVFNFRLTPEPKTDWNKIFLWSGVGTGAVSIGSYLIADVQYDKYKDFNNENRETHYNRANSLNRVCIISGVMAIGCLTTHYFVSKKERKELQTRTRSTNFYGNRLKPRIDRGLFGHVQLGLDYTF